MIYNNMEEIQINDWFAARMLNPDIGPTGLLANNITPENSGIRDADFYKNMPKVVKMFTDDNGKFDNDSFMEFHQKVLDEYKILSGINTLDVIMSEYERNPNVFSIGQGKKYEPTASFSFVANPQKQTMGVSTINEWEAPKISMREAAQNNRYFNNETGEWSSESVNEAGFWGLLTGESLVYATYDEDVFDENGELIHQKGEWKTDEFGNYYAETIGNKDSYGKQFVSLSEVLTTDGSFWNKIDFFDSDDLNSNTSDSILRSAAIIGSTFIPYVGGVIKFVTAAIQLAKYTPQVIKTIYGLFSEDDFDSLNSWENTMKKFSITKSDEAMNDMFTLENLFELVTDSYMQLAQQRFIAQMPEKLMLTKNAQDKINFSAQIQKQLGASDEMALALAKASPIYKDAYKTIEKYSKATHALSMAYMITTSAGDVFSQAKSYGFDNFTSSVIGLGTYVGLGTLFKTNYFGGMLTGSIATEEAKKVKYLASNWLKNNSKEIASDASKNVSQEMKVGFFKKWGKRISDHIKNHYDDVTTGQFGIVSGSINEGLEELSEEFVMDAAIQFGKGINEVRSAITGKEYSNNYNYLKTNPLERYSMSLFGGAIGGAVFKISDRLDAVNSGYAAYKEMISNNTNIEREFLSMIAAGKSDMVLSTLDKMENSKKYGNQNINAITGEPTTNYSESQSGLSFTILKKAIRDWDSFLTNNGIKFSHDDAGNVEIIKGIRAAYLKDAIGKTPIQKTLYKEYQDRIMELSDLKARRDKIEATLNDKNSESSNEEAKKAYKKEEIPVGAVIVKDGEIIARAHNLKELKNSSISHAEILAIQKANKNLNAWRLENCEMYITLEPCMMCMGAIINSRIKKIYVGTLDPKTGSCESVIDIKNYKFNHVVEIETGILKEECEYILKDFFKMLRIKKRRKKWKELVFLKKELYTLLY